MISKRCIFNCVVNYSRLVYFNSGCKCTSESDTILSLVYSWFYTLFQCALFVSFAAPSVSSSPDDQRAIPDDKKMFACSFIGNSIPHWLITKSDGTFETITSGTMTSMFKLPHISEIVGNGTVSQLEVTAALSLNGSTYMCQIVVAGGTTIDSAAATLTVYGRYWLMLHQCTL